MTKQELISELRDAAHKYIAEHISCDCGENYVAAECECATTAAEARTLAALAYLNGIATIFSYIHNLKNFTVSEFRDAVKQAMRLEGGSPE